MASLETQRLAARVRPAKTWFVYEPLARSGTQFVYELGFGKGGTLIGATYGSPQGMRAAQFVYELLGPA